MKKRTLICLILIFSILGLLCGCSEKKEGANIGEFLVSPATILNFGEVFYLDYSLPPRTVRITNNSEFDITANITLSGTGVSGFTLSDNSIDLTAESFNNITVTVNTGLNWGLYQAKLIVSASRFESYEIDLRFNVSDAEEKHLYIAFGQSNMQGAGTIRAQDKEGISNRWRILNVVQMA